MADVVICHKSTKPLDGHDILIINATDKQGRHLIVPRVGDTITGPKGSLYEGNLLKVIHIHHAFLVDKGDEGNSTPKNGVSQIVVVKVEVIR